jgi:hypothetical protein
MPGFHSFLFSLAPSTVKEPLIPGQHGTKPTDGGEAIVLNGVLLLMRKMCSNE